MFEKNIKKITGKKMKKIGEGAMKYEFKLIIVMAVLCMTLAQFAPADIVTKTLYVDGNAVGTGTTSQALSWPFNYLTIGCEGSEFYRYQGFKGQIDEFAIYRKVLDDPCIVLHYNAAPASYKATAMADAPRLYFEFADASSANGSVVGNSADGNYPGKYVGDAVYGDVRLSPGRVGNAADFNGASGGNGTCVSVNDSNGTYSTWLPGGDVTIEFWVRLDANVTSGTPRLFQHNNDYLDDSGYGAMYNMAIPDANSAIGVMGGGSTTYIRRALNDGNWHHIVITYDTISSTGTSYVREVMADDPCVYMRFESQNPIENISARGRYYWIDPEGELNPVESYGPTALVYGAGASSGLKDGAVRGAGFLNNTLIWKTAGDGGWASEGWFALATWAGTGGDGTMGYNAVSYDANWTFARGDITYEFWVKRPAPGDPGRTNPQLRIDRDGEPCDADPNWYPYYQTLFQQVGLSEPCAPGMGLAEGNDPLNPAGTIRVLTGVDWWYPDTQLPNDQQWHQIVLTYDVNGLGIRGVNDTNHMTVQLYFDGILEGSRVVTDPCGFGRATLGPWLNHLCIGGAADRGWIQNAFGGYMDEFAIYAGILSSDRVLAHYAAWQPRDCGELTGREFGMISDLDQDCDVDFVDFAEFALNWKQCNDPDPNAVDCTPNW